MRKKYQYSIKGKIVEKEYSYIPARYIFAALLTILEILAVIGGVVILCIYVPYFYIAAAVTSAGCLLSIIASADNPDYKIPWLIVVLLLPVAGFMLYLMFYSRKLKPRFIRRLQYLNDMAYKKEDSEEMEALRAVDPHAASQAKMLTDIASTHLFTRTAQIYFPSGEAMFESMKEDLRRAEKFIYLEYFIIEEGVFWNTILDILTIKASEGVDVKMLYDDVGCMSTLPGNYYKKLKKLGIEALPFSRLRGNADGEFNNRTHRKIMVIDGCIGYTGGANIADEYINAVSRFGHWKDAGIRLCGEAVHEMTKLFLVHFGMNTKKVPVMREDLYPEVVGEDGEGFLIPFGDGPRPIYERYIAKSVIQNMLTSATEYVYMTTPYLIIDSDLCTDIENAALRGVDVRIMLPHIPDKKLIFLMSRSFYPRLLKAGVKIYEYTPGFLHAKSYLADDTYAMVGTINLDYRSLVHHFENGVWMYRCRCIPDIKADITATLAQCTEITLDTLKSSILVRLVRAFVKIFAPML